MCGVTGVEHVDWAPLPGGWSGESFLSRVGDVRQVVRIYDPSRAHRPDAAQVDAALHRWVRGLVPVPPVVEVRPAQDGAPALLVTQYVPGDRGDDLVRTARERGDVATLTRVGEQLGWVAGTLAGVPTLRAGRFSAPDLVVVPEPHREDLESVLERCLPQLREWSPDLLDALCELVRRAQELLDDVDRTCLVHGDLGARNAVFGKSQELLTVIDWEHARAGDPYADLGSLLRFDRDPTWEGAVLDGWCQGRGASGGAPGGVTPALARELARCSDLGPLMELAARPGGNLVVDLADVHLREAAARGDWHATPVPGAPRAERATRLDA